MKAPDLPRMEKANRVSVLQRSGAGYRVNVSCADACSASRIDNTKVGGVIDIDGECLVANGNYLGGACREQRTSAAIRDDIHQVRKPRARQHGRYAERSRVVRGCGPLRRRAPGGTQPLQMGAVERRLIAYQDQRRDADVRQRRKPGAQRGAHAVLGVAAIHASQRKVADLREHGVGIGGQDNDSSVWAGFKPQPGSAPHQRFALQPQQLLGAAEPARCAGREDQESVCRRALSHARVAW